MTYSYNKGIKIINGIQVGYLQFINLRYLFTTDWKNLPYLIEDNVIYCIVNEVNGKCYVGQARNFYNRMIGHNGYTFNHFNGYKDYCINGGNKVLYRAIKKYHSINFTVFILEECDIVDILDEREKYWIKLLRTCIYDDICNGYNMSMGGEDRSWLNTEEVQKRALETKAKKYNGDPCSQLHTDIANMHRDQKCLELYGVTFENILQNSEIRKKALETKTKNGDGDCMYMCHTDESQLKAINTRIERYGRSDGLLNSKESKAKAFQTRIINSIWDRINELNSKGIDITPVSYYYLWFTKDYTWKVNNKLIQIHITSITDRLYDDPPIYEHEDWDEPWTELFRWFDDQDNWTDITSNKLIPSDLIRWR